MSCCNQEPDHCGSHTHGNKGPDLLLLGSLGVIFAALLLHFLPLTIPYASAFAHATADLLGKMWWGILAGIVAVGFMQKVPKAYFQKILGRGDTAGGIFRAALAGLLLDLCSHGILMVGAKLYERGASLAQVMTFLIASPWNSLTLTLILISLIGLKWTLIFIAGSAVIAIATGFIYLGLAKLGITPVNANTDENPEDIDLKADVKKRLKAFKPSTSFFKSIVADGYNESKMVMRWLFFGTIIAACIQAFVPADIMQTFFGPSLIGLGLTLIATTVIEVCSEGSAPIGADLVTRAGAPGNGFTFLMAGVATDYTELMVIREFTKKWAVTLSLPLITVPQILLLSWIMNQAVLAG